VNVLMDNKIFAPGLGGRFTMPDGSYMAQYRFLQSSVDL
jgi:hypothetical protein